jgi:hypothetical protein
MQLPVSVNWKKHAYGAVNETHRTAAKMSIRYSLDRFSHESARQQTTEDRIARRKDLANYIADMILELRNMAKANNMPTLLGLLEVSFYEAFSIANQVEIPAEELEKLRELSRAAND